MQRISRDQQGEYPVKTVDDLLSDIDNDGPMLDALVDLINRSPHSPQKWAAVLDIDFIEFVEVCHRSRPVSSSFRDKVRGFFSNSIILEHEPQRSE